MMLIGPAIDWATTAGPPNWVFVLALLTRPARWSSAAVAIVEARLLDGDVDVDELQEDSAREGRDG